MNRFATLLCTLSLLTHVSLAEDAAEWEIITGLDGDLYPSVIIATSTYKFPDEEGKNPNVVGDPFGLVGALVTAPEDNARIRVEIKSPKLIQRTVLEAKLPKGGETYEIYPQLKYDYESLLAVRQPFPEDVTVSVILDDKLLGEKTKRMVVRSINDCPFNITDADGTTYSLNEMFAAYVNENHPAVDEILGEALDSGDVEGFSGYQGSPDDVLKELEAIWNALKARGLSYSSITRSSKEGSSVASQHIRLVGDSLKTSQANCADGTVLFASILLKLEMQPFLVLLPDHMFVGVYLDDEQEEYVCIETTMLRSGTFEEAVEAGNEQFKENQDELTDEDSDGTEFAIVDVAEARSNGILPLREAEAERPKN